MSFSVVLLLDKEIAFILSDVTAHFRNNILDKSFCVV